METQPAVFVDNRSTLSLEVLKIITDAHAQHGLKHSNYYRYRGYCKRRIHRLRKSLGFVQATGNKARSTYQLKKITNEMVLESFKGKKDPLRFLLIVLMSAERCWAYAMSLKEEATTERRKRFHLLRRLAKATMYARILYGLCTKEPNRCDPRTKIEVEAYLCYMRGTFNFESAKWRAAASYLSKAQTIYAKLGESVGDKEASVIYQQRVEELKGTLRFCSFNLGEDPSIVDSFQKEPAAEENLASELDHMTLQSSEKQALIQEKALEAERAHQAEKLQADLQKYMCKPLFFDLALNHIEFPSLEEEMNAGATRGLTGFVKGLWSGGWKK